MRTRLASVGRSQQVALAAVLALAAALGVAALSIFTSGSGATPSDLTAVDPGWSPDGRKIAFVRQRRHEGGTFGALYVMSSDGGGVVQIVPEAQGVSWPTWSPDSRKIAFVSLAAGSSGIYVANADGSGARRVGSGHYPDWSPGGRKIAFNTGVLDSDVGDVMVMNPEGSRKTVVAASNGTTAYVTPTWSPDGERLAFVVVDAPDTAGGTIPYLVYVTQYGGRIRQLSHARAGEPDWSPSGRQIAFSHLAGQRLTVRVLDLRKQRTHFLHNGSHPRWSPDGRKIVFTESGHIHVMNADGSNVRKLTQ